MGAYSGPEIFNDGLVLALDAANPKSILNNVEVLVVAGGGGGGCGEGNVNGGGGGGGGGGGLIYTPSFTVSTNTSYTVTVGAGGASSTSAATAGNNGQNSVFGSLTAIGGGAGGGGDFEGDNAGAVGGSGGGAGGDGNYGPTIFSAGTAGQGNAGGARNGTTRRAGQGGGGAGLAGQSASAGPNNTGLGGTGGNGLQYTISGTATFYAGGGGGGASLNFSTGPVNSTAGLGGGGAGGGTTQGVAGTVNTGGGGGGGYGTGSGAGGSGIVIVRYPGYQRASGGTVTSVGGYTIHTFTASGTFTPGWGDLSGLGNRGTLVNGPTYSSANGGSIVFDGVDDAVDCGGNSSIKPTTGITVSTWIKFNGAVSNNRVLSDWHQNSSVDRWIFYTPNSTTVVWYMTSSGQSESGTSGYNFTLGQWVNLTGTYNQSQQILYVNGVQYSSISRTGALYAGDGSQTVRVGRQAEAGSTHNGLISNVHMYNRALTAAEVLQNFNALRGRFNI